MQSGNSVPSAITITLICRSDCPVSRALITELASVNADTRIRFHIVDVCLEPPPPFAQEFIVPATYLGEKLWRHGKYTRDQLIKRLAAEVTTG